METKAHIKFIGVILVATLSACSQSHSPDNDTNTDQAGVLTQEEEVKATLIKMWEAIENKDVELYASYIHPDFTQFGESDPTLSIGKEAEVNGTTEWIRNSSNIHTEMEEPIVVIKDSVAWILYYWKDHGTTNGEAFSSRGKSTRIFVKENGKWLCIHGHYTLLDSGL
jgi:ketosteroid isomerase-like protein